MILHQEEISRILSTRRRVSLERSGYTRAAILLPIFNREGGTHLLFTHRTETVSTHKGEISFPGGSIEPGDQGPLQTALREANEEVQIDPEGVAVAGILDDIFTITRYLITPVVGFCLPSVSFQPNPREIRRILEIPVERFLDPGVFRVETRYEFEGARYPIYYFHLPEETIWGATAKILKQFLEICCGWIPPGSTMTGKD